MTLEPDRQHLRDTNVEASRQIELIGAAWGLGKYGTAVQLDGIDDYVNLGDPPVLRLTRSTTISAWVNASSFPVDDAPVVSKRGSGDYYQQIYHHCDPELSESKNWLCILESAAQSVAS